jgi:hypothetical protein
MGLRKRAANQRYLNIQCKSSAAAACWRRRSVRLAKALPDGVFVIAAIDKRVNAAMGVAVKEAAAFGTGAEEEVGGLGEKQIFGAAGALGVKIWSLR